MQSAQSNFNSIKVQLEHIPVEVFSKIKKLFQFHKGTIRTDMILERLIVLASFQFHKGTIRTYKGVKLDKMFKDFNSIKVQLEP